MMLDAVTFDLGSARPPLFVFPDASGLAPLTLPDEFLRGQSHQAPSEFPSDTVRRFETAMSTEQPLPPSVFESLMASVISERPKVDGQEVESPKVQSQKSAVASIEVPTVAAVEKPVTVAPPAAPTVAPVALKTPDDPVKVEGHPVAASNTPIIPDAPPTRPGAMVEAPVAVDKPIGTSVEHSVRIAVGESEFVSANVTIPMDSMDRSADGKPVVASPEPLKAPVIVAPEKQVVIIEQTPAQPTERPTVATGEKSVVVSADKPAVAISDRPTVVSVEVPAVAAVEKPVTVAPSPAPTIVPSPVPTVPPVVLANPDDPVKVEGHPVAASNTPIIPDASATRPAAVVEVPVAVDKPIGASVGHSVRIAVGESEFVSANVTIPVDFIDRSVDEKPVIASPEPPTAPVIVAPERQAVVIEQIPANPVERPAVATGEKPVIASVDKPMVEIVDRPMIETVEISTVAAVEKPVVVAPDKPTVVTVEKPVVVATDKPTVVTVEKPVVVATDKPTVVAVEKPVVVTPDKPTVETLERPIVSVVERPAVATVAVPTDEKPVHADSTVSTESRKPEVAAVINPVSVETVEEPMVEAVDKTQVIAKTSVGPTVIIENTTTVPVERPVIAKVDNPSAPKFDKLEEKAVAAAAHVVVVPAAIEAPVPQALQAAPEVAAASAASARTEVIVETVNQIVEAVVGQILVTPGITQGECEIKIMLKPTVLDGSEITMSAKDGTLTVGITPATQEASAAAAAALPRLEIALAEHAPAFHHVSVALQLKKGNRNEAV